MLNEDVNWAAAMNKKKSMLMSIRSGLKKKTAHIVMSLCKFVIPTSGIPYTVQVTTLGKEAEQNSKEGNQNEKMPPILFL